jgi:hypothetical protein
MGKFMRLGSFGGHPISNLIKKNVKIYQKPYTLINFADQFNCDPLTCSEESDDSYVFFRAHIATDFTCGDQAYS